MPTERVNEFINGGIAALSAGMVAGVWRLVRRIFTNQQQIDALKNEIAAREGRARQRSWQQMPVPVCLMQSCLTLRSGRAKQSPIPIATTAAQSKTFPALARQQFCWMARLGIGTAARIPAQQP